MVWWGGGNRMPVAMGIAKLESAKKGFCSISRSVECLEIRVKEEVSSDALSPPPSR